MNQLTLRACAGLIGVACGTAGSTEPSGAEQTEAVGGEPASELSQETAALSPCLTHQSFAGQCKRLRRVFGTPYLDAYTGGDGDVVTRNFQSNSTQTWCFTVVDEGMQFPPSAPAGASWATFKLQHRTFSGQYLDAYTSSDNYKAVLRDGVNSDDQVWRAELECSTFHLIQESTGRHLDAYSSSGANHRAVTRLRQNDGTQTWQIE